MDKLSSGICGPKPGTLLSLAYKSYNAQAHSCQVPGGFFRSWQCHYILRASIGLPGTQQARDSPRHFRR